MDVKTILETVKTFAPAQLTEMIAGLPVILPIEALATLAEALYDEMDARSEAEQLRDAAKAVDAAIDAEEAEVVK